MRTYGRVTCLNAQGIAIIDPDTGKAMRRWVEVTTDAKGFDDLVWLTTLAQVLLLNLNESPFYATYGIPASQAVKQQLSPDFWVALTQQNFSQYFASLTVAKRNSVTPTYDIYVITQQGAKLNYTIGIPY